MATTKTWPDFQAQLTLELKADTARLTPTDLDEFLKRAGEIYSKDRPRVVVADIAATGAFEYSVPADWDNDESVAVQVEFPVGEQAPATIPDDEWMVYRSATGAYKLRFLETSPNGGTIRLTYTIPHVLKSTPTPNGTNTITDSAFMAVVYKGAQLACEGLAAQYARTSDPAINADIVNYRTKSQEFSDRAKEFLSRYEAQIGRDAAAGEIGEWDVTMVGGGRQLFHPPRWR
ncbi:MAG: hypothetical protein HYZ89_05450 [Candidatus Omnitrophica bacterium]|nr:hypothetical protein [Candidatus Omnitrophota bacterium]